ncbi:segment polarity protein dishevelled homolog DVL-3-like isoform X2 [Acipenser ruthenus]|uniref:segment polarity protein dishevelled homolog DVL-3-like isoform X2 n=1 Tax=Acipenser ruthenus TaxID=7906 RepID=UPI0027426370|nr:segment polarity protein dishevelled homolog DVL-3-like isoform X2 [Acipenser ruthenus]
MGETKIIYHIDDQETPYLVKLHIPADRVTLADFKNVLNKPNYKFFFKSMDDDFGVVKEEISEDNAKLPCFNGRVVSWLVSADGSHSDGGSVCADSQSDLPPPIERTGGIGDSRPPSFHANAAGSQDNLDNETETESVVSSRRERPRRKDSHEHVSRVNGHAKLERRHDVGGYESSSTLMSSELESTSFFDSEEDDSASRFSSSTEQSSSSRLMRRHKRRRRKPKAPRMERSSSFSSITDSTMSLNIITVILNMEKYNFLGISIVGQSNERGDGGIYIGSIMKGGAVAADGRIEPGDMLLQVNDINFENMSNDDAVRVLREIVHKPGPITLTVAKCWDPTPRGCFTLPRSEYTTPQGEPIRPIDPAAWVSHTAAMTGTYPVYGMSPSMSTITSTSSSITSSIPETERFDDFHLSIHSDMATIAKAMASPESGLEVRDRMWLKITIPNAFIGSDVVDWLYHHVEGFTDRREARKYASNLLKAGYIRHTVNKITFSEQCYYIFGDLCGNMANLSLNDHDGSSGTSDQDTLAPLPHPGAAPWPLAFPYQYPAPHPYNPPTGFHDPGYNHGGGGGSAGSQHSEGSRSSGSNRSGSEQRRKEETAAKASGGGGGGGGGDSKSGGSGSESDHTTRSSSSMRRERAPSERSAAPPSEHSLRSHHSATHSLRSNHSHAYVPPPHFPPPLVMMGPPGAPPGRDLASVPPELTASRQSFRMAMGNPKPNPSAFDQETRPVEMDT